MLSSDAENPPTKSDPCSLAIVVPSSSPGDGSAAVPASDSPHTSTTNSFSIREYVFRSRSKDIYTNWPFSRKNLQLCLQHGVREVLPPFRHLGETSVSKLKVPCVRGLDHAAEVNDDGAASNEQLRLVQSRVSQVTVKQVPAKEVIRPGTAGKKCRFIVKFDPKSERSLGDDDASNCTSISETTASKICPVCKTFSSSSNTTLNAYIDQCLSLESSPQRLLRRRRIKPRKSRLMVDIYETALRCTIEELNQRNGLNWANSSSLPASEEERSPSTLCVHAGNPSDKGAVYIDANGTKLRILSKFNDDPPELRRAEDEQSKKSSSEKKVNGILNKKSKKLHGQKHHKYLNPGPKGKKLHSQKACESQLCAKPKNLHGTQVGSEGSQGGSQLSLGPLKPGLSGSLKFWPSSKRTSSKKKFLAKEGENPQRCQLHLAPSLLVEDDQNLTSLDGRMALRRCTPNLLNSSENSDDSWSCGSEKERSWKDFRNLTPAKRKLPKENHFREVGISNIRRHAGSGEELQLRHRKGIDIHAVEGGFTNGLGNISERQLRPRPSATKALRFSTPRKRSLSLCQSSEKSSDISTGQVEFNFKKPKLQLTVDPAQDRSIEESANFEFSSSESSERETIDLREDAENSDGEVQYMKSTLNDMRNTEPSVDALEECTWGLGKYYELPHLNLRAYDACDAMNEENEDGGKGDEGNGVGQSTSFVEIDPIPIPGPPGSFLPSPGAMVSDDFQGNSSLTTSQVQSSNDQEDVVDGDLSDSPISATSAVLNSDEAKLGGMDHSEKLVTRGRPLVPEATWDSTSAAAPFSYSALVETIDRANNVSIKKGPPFTGKGDEPCCCQKKERAVSQSTISDYQIPSDALIPKAAKSTNISPSSRNLGKFSNGPGSSSSNPVLRLMGKDLIVVNKDDDAGVPIQSQSVCGIPFERSQNQDDLCLYKDMDYPPARSYSFFTGSSSAAYSGNDYAAASMMGPKYDFGTVKVKPVAPSKQMMPTVAPMMNPGSKGMMVTDKESGFKKCAVVNNMNLPRDVVLLPYASRGTSARGPAFLGLHGSEYVYYPRYS